MKMGDVVTHPKYGVGVVIYKTKKSIRIFFQGKIQKKFLIEYADLTKVD